MRLLAHFALAASLVGISQAQEGYVEAEPETDDGDGVVVRGRPEGPGAPLEDRPSGSLTRRDLERRQAQSTPDALRDLPGVYVQQTGHGQASPYIRGRTGQQTLMLVDGLRINHALFRQGPNQYLFTVDPRTIDTLEVIRGSASVELGASAIAGAIRIWPRDPTIDPTSDALMATPRGMVTHRTADDEIGGRLELDTAWGRLGLLAGVGYRTVGRLESAGSVGHVADEDEVDAPLFEKEVPVFEADGRTQLGTGFDELTADGRLVYLLGEEDRLVLATYIYRQFDAPRTDQCPPPEAPLTDCLVFTEQFRTHAYGRAELTPGWAALGRLEIAAGYQRIHERRERAQVSLDAINGGRDDIDVFELRARGETASWRGLWARYGVDGTRESVESAAWTELTRTGRVRVASRGQYLDGSRFGQGGLFLAPRYAPWKWLSVRSGVRLAAAMAEAPADAQSGTREVDGSWTAVLGNAGVTWIPLKGLSVRFNVEQGFRTPNLDDLTARQPTGRGFQMENPDLEPERALTLEVGPKWKSRRFEVELWAFRMTLTDLIGRRRAQCAQGDRECQGARFAIQPVNFSGTSEIHGLEASAKVRLPVGLSLWATLSYAKGESDSPADGDDRRVPLSRIPPLNGHVELRWTDRRLGLYADGVFRWAAEQTRLSVADEGDARIPFGGTPGYAVVDLRAGVKLWKTVKANLVLENLTDEPWRSHGSAINGAGRGLVVNVEVAPSF